MRARGCDAVRRSTLVCSLNLSQTEGPEIAVSVGTFFERREQMGAAAGPYGPEGAKARDLLANRGITPGVIQEARDLLGLLRKVAPPATPPSVEEKKQTSLARRMPCGAGIWSGVKWRASLSSKRAPAPAR